MPITPTLLLYDIRFRLLEEESPVLRYWIAQLRAPWNIICMQGTIAERTPIDLRMFCNSSTLALVVSVAVAHPRAHRVEEGEHEEQRPPRAHPRR